MSLDNDSIASMERQLLLNPFDGDLRHRYAQALFDNTQLDDALAQAELLSQQLPADARGALLAARVMLAQQRTAEALRCYQKARPLASFERVEELERLDSQAARRDGGTLRLVQGGDGARIHAIQQVKADKVRFSSIVGMDDLKKTIRLKIIDPYLKPGLFAKFRMQSGGGILLYGPPGCGKTMMARAIANECNAEFISIGISDVLNMWMGESERNLAAIFDKARSQTPCVLFFDELDALAFSRAKATSNNTRTLVNEFLSQLDGVGRENQGILVLAATNMPWDVDDAMKRPGRFSRQIFVPPPDQAARAEMLRSKLTGVPCDGLDLQQIAEQLAHYSGADIDGLIELAKESALSDSLDGAERGLNAEDFGYAMRDMRASTLEWLRTVRNVVKFAGSDSSFKDVELYLKKTKLI
jgi:ATP-dependent 26S proteasome regulatory subunit